MAGIRLEWSQFGDFDSFDVLRSSTTMDINNLPSPLVSGLTTMTYLDETVVMGATYVYRVVAKKGVNVAISDEVSGVADAGDLLWQNVTTLVFLNNNLIEKKNQLPLIWGSNNNQASFVSSPFGSSMLFTGAYYVFLLETKALKPSENLSGKKFTIEFFAKLNSNSEGRLVVLSHGDINGGKLSWWVILNKGSFYFTQSMDGSGSDTQSAYADIALINTVSSYVHYAVVREDSGLTRLYVGGILISETILSHTFKTTDVGLCIGRLNYDSYPSYFIGELGPVRITVGEARYKSGNFSPPTTFKDH